MSAIVANLEQIREDADDSELAEAFSCVVRAVAFLKTTSEVGMTFQLLAGVLRIVCYSDASFGGNRCHTCQLGGIVHVADTTLHAHIVTWFSPKCPRVTSSVLTADTRAFLATADIGYALRMELDRMGLALALDLLTDSKKLTVHHLAGSQLCHGKATDDRRRRPRERRNKGELNRVGFVRSEYNIADGLANDAGLDLSRGISALLETGQLSLKNLLTILPTLLPAGVFATPPPRGLRLRVVWGEWANRGEEEEQ
jgi:hypothetical protein